LLSAVFGLDLLTYAVMSNHLHVILRTRPDVVGTWSDHDVATRWLRLFPGKRIEEHLGEPTQQQVKSLLTDRKKLAVVRRRLSDVSWFMRCLAEPIARMANRQDGCTGRFWEGRFKCQKIVDEAGLLACSMYVDLNPIRAAMAQTPEQSKYTSAHDRIESHKGREQLSAACESGAGREREKSLAAELHQATASGDAKRASMLRAELSRCKSEQASKSRRGRRIARDAWLAPLELSERGKPGPQPSRTGLRASDKGFLTMPLVDYLKLLDWTGRQGRVDKRGKIPADLASILDRMGIEGSMWCDLVWRFKKYFGRSSALGRPASLRVEADKRHVNRIIGQTQVADCFAAEP
jgi:REP element-mobilizing transposase RayT